MLSLPLLAHPPRSADEIPAATTLRHAIMPPNPAPELLLAILESNDGSPLLPEQ
jgi:hypothetical protein